MFNSPIPASEDPRLELSYPGSRRRQSGVWRSLPRAFPRLEKEAKRGFLSFFLSIGLLYDVNNVLHCQLLSWRLLASVQAKMTGWQSNWQRQRNVQAKGLLPVSCLLHFNAMLPARVLVLALPRAFQNLNQSPSPSRNPNQHLHPLTRKRERNQSRRRRCTHS